MHFQMSLKLSIAGHLRRVDGTADNSFFCNSVTLWAPLNWTAPKKLMLYYYCCYLSLVSYF